MISPSARRGIVLMVASMAAFATADTLVKFSSADLSPPQIMIALLGGSLIAFGVLAKLDGAPLVDRHALRPVLFVRYAAEVVGMAAMVIALSRVPLSTVGAITQATPIVVTLGAVVFLAEKVGWRRWASIMAGFGGVLLIVQPGAAAFDISILWAVLALIALSVRDLTTPMVPPAMPSATLATCTMIAALPFALAWAIAAGEPFVSAQTNWFIVVPMIVLGATGYMLLIASLRMADVSVVMPYRYTRVVFLLAFGIVLFGETPTIAMLAGAALVVLAGIYILWRQSLPDDLG